MISVKPHKCQVYTVDWESKKCIDIQAIEEPSSEIPEEGLFFSKCFDSGHTVLISFIAGHPANKCPSVSSSSGVTSLRWSTKYSIPDFGFDASGVFGTLSFSSKPVFVYVAWDSVIEILSSDGSHKIWKEKIK